MAIEPSKPGLPGLILSERQALTVTGSGGPLARLPTRPVASGVVNVAPGEAATRVVIYRDSGGGSALTATAASAYDRRGAIEPERARGGLVDILV